MSSNVSIADRGDDLSVNRLFQQALLKTLKNLAAYHLQMVHHVFVKQCHPVLILNIGWYQG
jgi:hypothetical protein